MNGQLIDEAATEARATLHTLREQADRIAATIAELRLCSTNDPFFSVASAELQQAENARRALDGEIKLIEDTIAEQIAEARHEADAAMREELKPQFLELLKLTERARDARRKIVRRVEQHVERTGSQSAGVVPLGALESADDTRAWLRAEGLL